MILPRDVEAVIFDMDGLLVDSETLVRDVMLEAADQLGFELPLPVFLSMVGTTHGTSDAILMQHFGPAFDLAGYSAQVNACYAMALSSGGCRLKAGVLELLDDLDAAGLPRAICTSSSHPTVHAHLGPSGIIPRFDAIVARGDYVQGKPQPEPYLRAAQALEVAPERCLALEDSHNGVRAAAAAGMMTVMVPDLLAATDEIVALCSGVVETLHDVRAAIRIGQPKVA